MQLDTFCSMEPLPGHTFVSLKVGLLTGTTIGHVELNRPSKSNAFDTQMWEEFPKAIEALDASASTLGTRVIIVSGSGKNFCAGIDLGYLHAMFERLGKVSCPGRMREQFRRHIMTMQDCFTSLERCRLPVIAAVQGCCVGGGVDLITACDIRMCSEDATFCVKEVDIGIVADLGTLQRLPNIIGHGPAMDLALTARTIGGTEALRMGLVSKVVPGGREELLNQAIALASILASKPPLALAGTKRVLLHTRDCPSVRDGLEYVATWNSAQLVSEDVQRVLGAMGKQPGGRETTFSKL